MPFTSVREIRDANNRIGESWFDASTMEFFNSQVDYNTLIDGRLFLSSEHPDGCPARKWTVREATDDGRIEKHGEFMEWPSKAEALAAAFRIVQDETT